MDQRDLLSIGEVSDRTGLAASATRFYEHEGLISASRTHSGHRRFRRADLRRLSFIGFCQRLGYSLAEIGGVLAELGDRSPPTDEEWRALADSFRADLDRRIESLEALRDRLDGCIGCGCLSMQSCAVFNADDRAAGNGAGPRWLLGDSP